MPIYVTCMLTMLAHILSRLQTQHVAPPPQARSSPAHWYLAPDNVPREYDPRHPVTVAVTNFITAFILYSE